MWASFRLRKIALKFFRRVALSFQELTSAKNAFVSLCYDKPSRSFVIISQRRPLFKVEVKSQELTEAEIWEQIVYICYCDVKHNPRIDQASNEIPSEKEEM